ncbi:MAG: type II toxin-antitoxin system VapC family toxin [Deltaproteobacteria bacterium]|nr:type II toxin-antitoxin system VapC family toxin [Deltaproteobacteria bacterium]
MILFDTDICIEILRGNEVVIEKLLRCDERVAICFMTVGELFYGAERSKYKFKNLNLVDEFILSIDIINTDFGILRKFGELKSNLYEKNIMLSDADILIASTALTKCSKLITGNVKHFNRFENLVIENWIR